MLVDFFMWQNNRGWTFSLEEALLGSYFDQFEMKEP